MQKPNIIFILTDDMGYKDLGCYGSYFYETPHIDSLSKEGALFTDAYATCPVCSPSRASIMSGKYPARLKATNYFGGRNPRGKLIEAPYIDRLSTDEKSIASRLREEGYDTWHIGKWHLGPEECWPCNHGFDINIGGCDCGRPPNGYFSPYNIENLPDGPEGEYLTDRLSAEAANLIYNSTDNPFFMFMSHYTVHTPLQAKPEDIAYFQKKAKDMGIDKLDAFIYGEHMPCVYNSHKRVVRRIIQSNAVYAAMIKSLDDSVGELIAALKQTGKYENTLIIFTSDNGGLSTCEAAATSNLPLCEGKGWVYEGGVRVPLIMSYPNKIKPSIVDQYVTGTDFYPTILDITDIKKDFAQHCDGMSFKPLFDDKQIERGPIFWHYPHYGNQGGTPAASVRMGDFKLIKFFERENLELYNLRQDVGESKDLINEHPDIAVELEQLLTKWQADTEANFPVKNPDWV